MLFESRDETDGFYEDEHAHVLYSYCVYDILFVFFSYKYDFQYHKKCIKWFILLCSQVDIPQSF